jgi:hypothetical protein
VINHICCHIFYTIVLYVYLCEVQINYNKEYPQNPSGDQKQTGKKERRAVIGYLISEFITIAQPG